MLERYIDKQNFSFKPLSSSFSNWGPDLPLLMIFTFSSKASSSNRLCFDSWCLLSLWFDIVSCLWLQFKRLDPQSSLACISFLMLTFFFASSPITMLLRAPHLPQHPAMFLNMSTWPSPYSLAPTNLYDHGIHAQLNQPRDFIAKMILETAETAIHNMSLSLKLADASVNEHSKLARVLHSISLLHLNHPHETIEELLNLLVLNSIPDQVEAYMLNYATVLIGSGIRSRVWWIDKEHLKSFKTIVNRSWYAWKRFVTIPLKLFGIHQRPLRPLSLI